MHKPSIGIGQNQPLLAFLIRPQPDLSESPARIFRRHARGPISGRVHTTEWTLRLERRRPPSLDPPTGCTDGNDPNALVELTFGSRSEAIGYAERQGLTWRVVEDEVIALPRISQTRPGGPRCRILAPHQMAGTAA